MRRPENSTEFYQRFDDCNASPGKFNVYKIEEFQRTTPLPHYRRDFYKISLLTKGEGTVSYANISHHIKNNLLSFSNPLIPYSWDPSTHNEEGYFCLFKEEFIDSTLRTESIAQSPLFKINGDHVLFPDKETVKFIKSIFEKMLSELRSPYENKYALLRNYVEIIIHEGLKIKTPDKDYHTSNSAGRICNLFLELLESQFPIDSPYHPLKLKSPSQMAGQLAIHPNHLNRALRETTGKTTSELITARIVKEAKALLGHTDWDITTIGYCLGFGHSSNFNLYFKKHTGRNPSTFRRASIVNS